MLIIYHKCAYLLEGIFANNNVQVLLLLQSVISILYCGCFSLF